MNKYLPVSIVKDGWLYILVPLVVGGGCGWWAQASGHMIVASLFYGAALVLSAFMVYFFRDPVRVPSAGPEEFVSGADGCVRTVERVDENAYLKGETIRLSVFLNPFNVHVNRSPMAGRVRALAYTPGKRLFTFQDAASERNEHSSILIEGDKTRCLVKQIVGPVVRRVVYWLHMDQQLGQGDRIGIMKFGSRMDIYFPASEVEVLVKKGDKVRAGETIVARLKQPSA